MLIVFIDISDIRLLFLNTPDPTTGQRGVWTESDFKIWLFEAVNFLNFIYTDFAFCSDVKERLSAPLTQFEGLEILHESLSDVMQHPHLQNADIFSSYGYIYGDLLYFQLEVSTHE